MDELDPNTIGAAELDAIQATQASQGTNPGGRHPGLVHGDARRSVRFDESANIVHQYWACGNTPAHIAQVQPAPSSAAGLAIPDKGHWANPSHRNVISAAGPTPIGSSSRPGGSVGYMNWREASMVATASRCCANAVTHVRASLVRASPSSTPNAVLAAALRRQLFPDAHALRDGLCRGPSSFAAPAPSLAC